MRDFVINGKLAEIGEDFYFSLTQTIIDINEPTVIGLPATKEVTIPRSSRNDEIKGSTGKLTRLSPLRPIQTGIFFNDWEKAH